MDMELQSALMSKDEKYSARDCPSNIETITNFTCLVFVVPALRGFGSEKGLG